MERQRPHKHEDEEQIQFEQDLCRALRLGGLLLPETEEEVRAAEAENLSEALPLELRDPHTVLKRVRGRRHKVVSIGETASHEIEENLARAAREGGKIPPDVERVMQRDREAAERKRSGNEG
jgi:hypothetical protein